MTISVPPVGPLSANEGPGVTISVVNAVRLEINHGRRFIDVSSDADVGARHGTRSSPSIRGNLGRIPSPDGENPEAEPQ